jgi:hypothetical protein
MQHDFIARQYEIAQQLVRCMTSDVEYQRQLSDMAHHYEAQLAERNRKIKKLESTIEAMKALNGEY